MFRYAGVVCLYLVCILWQFVKAGGGCNIISPFSNVLDHGVYTSSNCTFDFHVANVYKRSSNLIGWILITFNTRTLTQSVI